MNVTVNALGDKCPTPVIKAKAALESMTEPGVLEILVDNEISVQNLTRFAAGRGCKAASEKKAEAEYAVRITVESLPEKKEGEEIVCAPSKGGKSVVAVGSQYMGSGSEELGASLMKAFIYALSQQDELPAAILFYNGGANLTCEGSGALEDLKSMEAQGVEILTCGTCLNFYGLSDKLAVGAVTNMYSIVEKMMGASRIIKP